jgi:hypothetical protein
MFVPAGSPEPTPGSPTSDPVGCCSSSSEESSSSTPSSPSSEESSSPSEPSQSPSSSQSQAVSYCYQQYQSTYDCPTHTWGAVTPLNIPFCSNSMGPGDLIWVTNAGCLATIVVKTDDNPGTCDNVTVFCEAAHFTPPDNPFFQGLEPNPTCCPSSSSSEQSSSSTPSSSSEQSSSSTPSSEQSSSSELCDRYNFFSTFNPSTCVWSAVDDTTIDFNFACSTDDPGWDYYPFESCRAVYTKFVPAGSPAPATPSAPTLDAPSECPCSSSSSSTPSSSSEASSPSSVVSSSSTPSSEQSSAPSSNSSGLCDVYFLSAQYYCEPGGGCIPGQASWFVSVVGSQTDQSCDTSTDWEFGGPCDASKTVYVPAGTVFTNDPCADYYPDIDPGPTCCPSSSSATSSVQSSSSTAVSSSETSSETSSGIPDQAIWTFGASYDCDTSEWTYYVPETCATFVPGGNTDGPWVDAMDGCSATRTMFNYDCDNPPAHGTPPFIPSDCPCASSSSSQISSESSATSSQISSESSTTSSQTSSESSATCDGPQTITYTSTISTDDCSSGTTTIVLNKTASTATTFTYSIISYDSPPWPQDCVTCPQLWCDDCHSSVPDNTSPDWVWNCNLNEWETGGWCSNFDTLTDPTTCTSLSAITGTITFTVSNPCAATFTNTAS